MEPSKNERALRARIGDLEAEVDRLRGGGTDAPRDRNTSIEMLVVDQELDLHSISADLALQILDALPVQIFIKRANKELYPGVIGEGRRYTFLNQKAAILAGWNAEDAAEHLDCEAMVDPAEYAKMESAETQTIREKRRSDRQLRWTSDDGSWRVNDVIQLPVMLRSADVETGEAIGFCAIAQDIEFQQRATATEVLMRVMKHEVANLAAKVGALIRKAERRPAEMQQHLKRAAGWVEATAAIAEAMLASYEVSPLPGQESTVESVLARLQQLLEPLPAQLSWSVQPQVRSLNLRAPRAITGILVEVARNAIKHTSDEFLVEGIAPVSIDVRTDGENIIWTVINRCTKTTGRLVASKSLIPMKSERMGGQAIMDIIAHAFLVETDSLDEESFARFIKFSDDSVDRRTVTVQLFCPIDPLLAGNAK